MGLDISVDLVVGAEMKDLFENEKIVKCYPRYNSNTGERMSDRKVDTYRLVDKQTGEIIEDLWAWLANKQLDIFAHDEWNKTAVIGLHQQEIHGYNYPHNVYAQPEDAINNELYDKVYKALDIKPKLYVCVSVSY